jgi:dual specificity tyrosine-phosphorylation-regulated kinase 2/3/4
MAIIQKGTQSSNYFDLHFNPIKLQDSKGVTREPGSKKLEEVLDDNDFADFISRCLEWDAGKRMTPTEGLSHKWLKG